MVKKILSILFSLAVICAYGQSLQIVSSKSDTLVVGNAYNENDIESYVVVKNVSSQPIDVLVKRIDKNYNALTDSNAICWGICFATDVSVSPLSTKKTLQSGEEAAKYDFVGHVYPDMDGIARQGDITYVFFNANDNSDTVAHTVTYKTTMDFSVDEPTAQSQVTVYPNPASDRVEVKYDLVGASQGTFEIINLVGSTVYRKKLNTTRSQFGLNLSELSSGVYFYVLKSTDKVLSTKKLVIN